MYGCSFNLFFSNSKYCFKNGWNLIGINLDSVNIDELGDQNRILSIFSYKNGKWTTKNQLTSLNSGQGYWIKADNISTSSISLSLNGEPSSDNSLHLTGSGWYLANIPNYQLSSIDMDIFRNDGISKIYKYIDNKWQMWNNDGKSNEGFSSIKNYEGFWIKHNTDTILNFSNENSLNDDENENAYSSENNTTIDKMVLNYMVLVEYFEYLTPQQATEVYKSLDDSKMMDLTAL